MHTKEKDTVPLNRKIIASLILGIFVINLLPAQSFGSSAARGQIRLERYLDRARLEQSEDRWKALAQEGLVMALAAWESQGTTQVEDPETYELVKAVYEKNIEEKFIEWKATKAFEEKNALKTSLISSMLGIASATWEFKDEDNGDTTRQITEEQAAATRDQWEKYASELVASYINVSDYSAAELLGDDFTSATLSEEEQQEILNRVKSNYEQTLKNESYEIIQAEENNLLRYLLYDQYSLRKQTDSEAAQVIATTLANEATVETTNDLNNIFSKIDTIIENNQDDLESAQEAWMEDFTRQMNASLDRWDQAEEAFLIKRSEWEKDAVNVYLNDEAIWQKAFDTLEEKRREWNKDILQKLQEGQDKWGDQQTKIKTELNEILNDYIVNLENEKSTKEKTLDVQVSIYNTSREILQMSSQGIQNWYNHWGERYKGLYAYWKTEAANNNSVASAALTALKDFEDKIEVTENNKKVINPSEFDNSSYITSKENIEKVFSMINVWKEYYLKAIQNELNKAYSIEYSRYNPLNQKKTELEAQITSLQQTIADCDEYINSHSDPGVEECSKQRSEASSQLSSVRNELRSIEDRYTLEKEKFDKINRCISLVNSTNFSIYEFSDYDNLLNFDKDYAGQIRSNQASFKLKKDEILRVLGNLNFDDYSVDGMTAYAVDFKETSVFLNDDLFTNSDTIFGSEETLYTWYYDHIQYINKCNSAINEIVALTGNVSTITLPHEEGEESIQTAYDELTLELYKAEAVKKYWEEQKAILQECVDYIQNKTSTADTVQETQNQYKAAERLYKLAEEAYDAQVSRLTVFENAVTVAKGNLETARVAVLQAFNDLQKKQASYEEALSSYNGVSNDSLKAAINAIIDRINNNEESDLTKSNTYSDLQSYYNAYQDYSILKVKQSRSKARNTLAAVEDDELLSKESYVKVLNKEKLLNPETSLTAALQEFNKIPEFNQYENQKLQYVWNLYKSNPEDVELKLYVEILVDYLNNQNEQDYEKQTYAYNYLKDGIRDVPSAKSEKEIRFTKSKFLLSSAKSIIDYAVENNLVLETYYYSLVASEIEKLLSSSTLEVLNASASVSEYTEINDILCGHGIFADQYLNEMMIYGYYNYLWADNNGKNIVNLEMVKSVKEDYSMYDYSSINTQNNDALLAVKNVMTNSTGLSVLDYIDKLYDAGENLDSIGTSALDLYVQEYLRNKVLAGTTGFNYTDKDYSKEVEAQRNLINKVNLWGNTNTLDGIVAILDSEEYKKIDSSVIESAIEEYAAYLAYNDIVLSGNTGVLTSKTAIQNYLLNLDTIKKFKTKNANAATELCSTIAQTLYNFYNTTYKDYTEPYKSYSNYLNSSAENQNLSTAEWAQTYKKAETLSKNISDINNYWSSNREDKYATKYIVDKGLAYDYVCAKMNTSTLATLKAYFESKPERAGYVETFYYENLRASGSGGLYTVSDIIEAMNGVISWYNSGQTKRENHLAFVSDTLEFFTEENIEQAQQNEITSAINEASFVNYDLNVYDQKWYSAYLVSPEFFYTYLSQNDTDLDMLNAAYRYAQMNDADINKKEAYKKLNKYLTVRNTINEYSPYLETSVEEYLKDAGLDDDVYNAVYDYFCYGTEYWTESHYADQVKNLTSCIIYKTGENDSDVKVTLNSAKYINNISKANDSFFDALTLILQQEQKKYNEYNIKNLCKSIADNHEYEDLSYQAAIIADVLQNIEKNETGETFELNEITKSPDYTSIYAQYFLNGTSTRYFDKDISESEEALEKKISIYGQSLNRNDRTRQAYLEQLKSTFNTLSENQKKITERLEQVRTRKTAMDAAKEAYAARQTEYDTSMTTYKSKVDDYNTQVSELNDLYKAMEAERLTYRTKKEIYEWAENTYLRSETNIVEVEDYENEQNKVKYQTPQERLALVSNSCTAAQISYKVLKNLAKETSDDTLEEETAQYSEKLKEFEKKEQEYYIARVIMEEVQSATSAQRNILDSKMIDEKVSISRLLNISDIDKENTKDIYKVAEKTKDLICWDAAQKKFVLKKTLRFDPSYSTVTNSEGEEVQVQNEKDITVVIGTGAYYDDAANAEAIRKYLNDDKSKDFINAYGEKYNERQSQVDAEAWLKEMENKQQNDSNYFEKVVLAAMYLQYMAQGSEYIDLSTKYTEDDKEAAQKENTKNFGAYDNPLDRLGFTNVGKSNGVDYPVVMKEKGEIFLQDIYVQVSQDDIAKYLLYKDTYLGGRLNIVNRAVDYLRNEAMVKTIAVAQSEKDGYVAAGIAFTALAAGFLATAAIPIIGAWALIPAGINTTLAAIEHTKARDTQAVIDKINDVKNNEYKNLEKDRNYLTDGIKDWADKTNEKDTAQKELNLILYGTETAPEENANAAPIDAATLRKAIETALKKSKFLTISDYDNLVKDKDFDTIINNATTRDAALSAIISYCRSGYDSSKTALHNEVFETGLLTQQQNNAKTYYDKLNLYLNNEETVTDAQELEDNLAELAKAAWGTGTFRSNAYYTALMNSADKLNKNDVMFNRSTEGYIYGGYDSYGNKTEEGLIDLYVENYLAMLEAEKQLKIEAKRKENELVQNDLDDQIKKWKTQISYILSVSDAEWVKAKQRLNSDHYAWQESYVKAYNDAIDEWNDNYSEFLEGKKNWIVEQYLNASQGKWESSTADYNVERENIINNVMSKSGFIGKLSETMEAMDDDSETYVNSITNTALLNNIMSFGSELSSNAGTGLKRAKKGNEINTQADEWLKTAMQKSIELAEDYQKVSAKLSEQQMKEQLTQTISSYMERIDAQNESMREWEISLVQSEGYSVNGRTISRNTVIDSTLIKNVKKVQKVAMYEDFVIARPDIPVSAEGSEDGQSMMEKILAAINDVKLWAEKVFGKVNADGTSVKRTFQKTAFNSNKSNGVADSGIEAQTLVEQYETRAQALDNASEEYKKTGNEAKIRQLEEEMKAAGGFSKLSKDKQKEYTNLTGAQATLNDGAINEWIGYAPTFKSGAEGEELDYTKNALDNLKYEGKGQMGMIMLDFQWNNMEEGYGFSELAKPMYDKKMWDDDNSFIQPPTFRDVLDIALEVVGNCTGQKWVGWIDDALFAMTDLTGGYKTAAEVGLELGKKVATKAVSAGLGKTAEWAGGALADGLKITSDLGKAAVQAGVNMASSAVTSATNTAINSIYINEDGGLDFNSDAFSSSMKKMSTWSSVVSSGITGGMNALTKTDAIGNALSGNVFYNEGIQRFNSLTGSLAASGLEYLVDGETSFNVLNVADLFDMFGSEYKEKKIGKDGKVSYSSASTGLLEIKVNKDKGVSAAVGRGGTDVSLLHTLQAVAGASESTKLIKTKVAGALGDKEALSNLNVENGLGYTNDPVAISLARDIWKGRIKLQYDVTEEDGARGYSLEKDRSTIHLSKDMLAEDNQSMVNLAALVAHEGMHARGLRYESMAYAQELQTYALLTDKFKTDFDCDYVNTIFDGFMAGINDSIIEDSENGTFDLETYKAKVEETVANGEDPWDLIYKKNTGDRDNWAIRVEKGHIYADWDGTQNVTLPDGTVIKVNVDKKKLSASKLSSSLFGNEKSSEAIEKLFADSPEKLEWNEKESNWFTKDGKILTADDNFSIDITGLVDSNKKYSKAFDFWLTTGSDGQTGMDGVDLYDIGGLPDGLFGYVNRSRMLADIAAMTSTYTGTALERVTAFKNEKSHFAWVGGDFSKQYARMFQGFKDHIGGSIAPNAQTMEFSDDTFEDNDVEYSSLRKGKSTHTGGDTRGSVVNTEINSAFGGRIDPKHNPLQFSTLFSKTGSSVTVESGYNFGDRFISTSVWLQYRHMKDLNANVNGKVITANTNLGKLSNVWSAGTIAAHLHLDIVTESNSNDSQWFQNLFPTTYADDITWKVTTKDGWKDGGNTYNRTYWKPKQVWDGYWKVVK